MIPIIDWNRRAYSLLSTRYVVFMIQIYRPMNAALELQAYFLYNAIGKRSSIRKPLKSVTIVSIHILTSNNVYEIPMKESRVILETVVFKLNL